MRIKIYWRDGWAHAYGTAPGGQRIRRALKTQDPRQAEEARSRLETRLWREDLYGAEAVVTFEECALHYAEDGGEARFLPQVAEQLHGRLLRDITPTLIRTAARRAYPKASPATLNRQFIIPARAVINYGHAQGWCPPIKVKAFPTPKPKRQAVDRSYLDALRPHLPDRAFALLLFLHETGRRVGDAIKMTPDQVQGTRVLIPETKNGEPAVAHLTREVAELISRLEPRHGLVFGYVHRHSLYNSLRRAASKAGLPYLGTHQIGRHSFATILSEEGWGVKAIAEAGGWKSTRMVSDVYEHPTDVHARAASVFGRKKRRDGEPGQETRIRGSDTKSSRNPDLSLQDIEIKR